MTLRGTVTGLLLDGSYTRGDVMVPLRVGVEVTLDGDAGDVRFVVPAGQEPAPGDRVTVEVTPA